MALNIIQVFGILTPQEKANIFHQSSWGAWLEQLYLQIAATGPINESEIDLVIAYRIGKNDPADRSLSEILLGILANTDHDVMRAIINVTMQAGVIGQASRDSITDLINADEGA